MKPRKLKPRPKPLLTREISYAFGAYHAFWLFREGERDYKNYDDLLPRRDAPVSLSDDVLCALSHEFQTVASTNPANPDEWPGYGLNNFGPTIINQSGGVAFGAACRKAAQEWAKGPELLVLEQNYYGAVFINDKRMPNPYRFKVDRDLLVHNLETLAGWGDKAATGAFFILHVGL